MKLDAEKRVPPRSQGKSYRTQAMRRDTLTLQARYVFPVEGSPIENGVVTNRCKAVHPGRTITSFVNGTRRLFTFVDDNPSRTDSHTPGRHTPSAIAMLTADRKSSSSRRAAELEPR